MQNSEWVCVNCATVVFQYSIGDALDPRGAVSPVRHYTTFNTPLEMRTWLRSVSTVEAETSFNTPLEMPGVLDFGFCGFLSFCVGVCGLLDLVSSEY